MNRRIFLWTFAFLLAACARGGVVAVSEPLTTTSASAPSTAPVATTVAALRPVLLVPAGDHLTDPGIRMGLGLPDGWANQGWAVGKHGGDPPGGLWLSSWYVDNIYRDACQWQDALLDPPVGPSVDDLATALSENWGSNATVPTDVMIDGFAGKQLVLTVPSDVDFAECDAGKFEYWLDTSEGDRYSQGPGQVEQLWIIDVNGFRLVIDAASFPETSPQDQAELQQMIDSIHIESE